MSGLSEKQMKLQEQDLQILELEISNLEEELQALETKLNHFEAHIRSKLYFEIRRIQELTVRYKQLKQAKKAKRLEQKKRGKNYQEPIGLKRSSPQVALKQEQLSVDKLQMLKRMYKEAIVQIHPDKFANENAEKAKRATALTVRLNALYKQEDFEELSLFHQHIISGNAMSHVFAQPETIVNTTAMVDYLNNKKRSLLQNLAQAKQTSTYVVLTTYSNPYTFIDELREEFSQRIRQLEKRTRKA